MKLVLASLFMMGSVAFADHHEGKMGENFETHKQEALKRIDERLAKLQEHKTCVTAAANGDAMKACHEKMKAFREEMREEGMENRMEKMDKRMEKMKARQEKMKEKK